MPIVTDRPGPYEAPFSARAQDYQNTPPSFMEEAGAGFMQASPTRWLADAAARGRYEDSSAFDRAVDFAEKNPEGSTGVDFYGIKEPLLPPEEINKTYGPTGPDGKQMKITDRPMSAGLAQVIAKQKEEEVERQMILSRAYQSHTWYGQFGMDQLAFIMDPINASTMFVPGFGEGFLASKLGTGAIARLGARAVVGAGAGAASMAPIEALRYATQDDQDASWRDGFRNLFYAAGWNALFHTGFGAISELRGIPSVAPYKPGAAPAPQPAGTVSPIRPVPGEPFDQAAADRVLAGKQDQYEADLVTRLGGNPANPQDLYNAAMVARWGRAIVDTTAKEKYELMRTNIAQFVDGRVADSMPVLAVRDIARNAEEAQLRARLEQLNQPPPPTTFLSRLIPGAQEAAERLARVRQVESDLQKATTEEERRPLLQRRDELLEGTTPEALSAQAAPLEQQRRAEAQRASMKAAIEARLAEIGAARARPYLTGEAEARTLAYVGGLPEIAGGQSSLWRQGFQPGISNEELNKATQEIFGEKEKAPAAKPVAVAGAETQPVRPAQLPVSAEHPVATDVAEKLGNIYSPVVARTMGILRAAMYATRARLRGRGETAAELYAREGAEIRSGEIGVVAPGELAQSAMEIKGNPEGEAEDAAWRRQEPEKTAEGKYKGAPDWLTTPAGLRNLRRLITQLVVEGAPGRFWYEESARRINEITGGNVQKTEKLIGLVAIYSPQTPVFTNMNFAIKAYEQFMRGDKIDVKTGAQDARAQAWMERGEDWGGRKTNSFYLNLMHEIVTEHPAAIAKLNIPDDVLTAVKRATVDIWVLRALGYKVDSAGEELESKGNKYAFAERELQRAASTLNANLPEGSARWLPHQVQAALWSAIKARYELPEVKEKTWAESLQAGFAKMLPDEKGVMRRTAPDKYGPERQGHMAIWRKNALAASPEDVARQVLEAKGSFGDAIDRVAQNVTWEAIPSTSLGADINRASLAVKMAFTRAALKLLTDDDGNDVLAARLGVNLNQSRPWIGAYAGEINPNVITKLVPAKPAGFFDASKARQYARAIQTIFRQDAVPFFRADPKADFKGDFRAVDAAGKTLRRFDSQAEAQAFAEQRTAGGKKTELEGGKFAHGIHLAFKNDLTPEAERALLAALNEHLGPDAGFTKTGPREVTVINFRGDKGLPFMDDESFFRGIGSLIDARGTQLGVDDAIKFGAEAEYGPTADWKADPRFGSLPPDAAGSPALQSWVRDRQQAFDALLREWSGPGLAAREAAEAGAARELKQPGPTGPRGKISLGAERAIMWIARHGDASTFIHETGHEALDQLLRDAEEETAHPQLKADAQAVLDWLGAKDRHSITDEQHEMFARAFEQYVHEGKAPTSALDQVFQKLKDWMTAIYKSLVEHNVPMTDDIRGVMDRMIGEEERPTAAAEAAAPKVSADPELQEAERALAAAGAQNLTAEDHADLEQAAAHQQMAENYAAAYAQAGLCIAAGAG